MSINRLIPMLIVTVLAACIGLWLYFAKPATDEPYAISQPPSDQPAVIKTPRPSRESKWDRRTRAVGKPP